MVVIDWELKRGKKICGAHKGEPSERGGCVCACVCVHKSKVGGPLGLVLDQ